ncbi:MAG: hypothetical protein KGJ55_11560 [Gammaproteobacteria bacterium]|nr:hypothetical protein [Gammaproteobacteria bacterium]
MILSSGSLGLAGCGLHPAATTPPAPAAPSVAPPPRIGSVAMRRYGCFGSCPAYDVRIAAPGNVDYRGYAHVASTGKRHGVAENAALIRLWRLLDSVEFAQLATNYLPGRQACGPWSSDGATIVLKVNLDGRERQIRHYTGCPTTPGLLTQVEAAIDAAAQDQIWLYDRAER